MRVELSGRHLHLILTLRIAQCPELVATGRNMGKCLWCLLGVAFGYKVTFGTPFNLLCPLPEPIHPNMSSSEKQSDLHSQDQLPVVVNDDFDTPEDRKLVRKVDLQCVVGLCI